jgi:predicted ester cyclase
MPAKTATVIDQLYEAWNRHDPAAIAAPFAGNGWYTDPLKRSDLSGDNLSDHVQNVLDVIRDLRITVTRMIENEEAAAAVWTIEGTWDGKLGPLTASQTPVRFEGNDVFEFEGDHFRRVRRSFDQLAVADALRLQTIVEPYSDDGMTFGHSLRSWVSKEKPAVLGSTSLATWEQASP